MRLHQKYFIHNRQHFALTYCSLPHTGGSDQVSQNAAAGFAVQIELSMGCSKVISLLDINISSGHDHLTIEISYHRYFDIPTPTVINTLQNRLYYYPIYSSFIFAFISAAFSWAIRSSSAFS